MNKNNPSFPTEAVKSLQTYIAQKIEDRGFKDETLQERLLLLFEEVGELANAIRHKTQMNVDKNKAARNQVGEEVADIINLIFAVAIKLELDVAKEFLEKEAIIDKRTYTK